MNSERPFHRFMRVARKGIQTALRPTGYYFARIAQPTNPVIQLGADLVLDVGANTGLYAREIRRHGYRGRIVSFEPLPDIHEQLRESAKSDPNWVVHDRCALGPTAGTTEINISGLSGSSSILPMRDAHIQALPGSGYIGKTEVEMITLDSVFDSYGTKDEKTFLKLDVQGYEEEMLQGAVESLPKIFGVRIELSVVPMYEHQALYRHFLDFFEGQGFGIWSLDRGFGNDATGQMYQFDATFVRDIG